MSFVKLSTSFSPDTSQDDTTSKVRPRFNSQLTADRLRESTALQAPPFKMGGNIRKGRRSVFKELGLDEDFVDGSPTTSPTSPQFRDVSYGTSQESREFGQNTGSRSEDREQDGDEEEEEEQGQIGEKEQTTEEDTRRREQRQNSFPLRWYAKLARSKARPRIRSTSGAPPGTISGFQRFAMLTMIVAVIIPALSWRNGPTTVDLNGADAGVLRKRETSPTDVCVRWAHQSALLNGTLYIYGGQAKTEGDQQDNKWNNNFLYLDLTQNWTTDSPALEGLTLPDGPPKVAMGYLWHDYNNLYLYGGQFSDTPYVAPGSESLWGYSIGDEKWSEFKEPKTSEGKYSEPANQPVHRAAEGAGISVPELGLSWYFGGHLDWATTPGWSRDTDRVYLKSLLEFTHPGYTNTGVYKLADGSGAAEGGVFRNITKGGVQTDNFPERADGVLVFIPGWGEKGVLIGLAGGTADTFTDDLRKLDVYDIANSEWFHQDTSGDAPSIRVNPCAVVASASDGSSFQVYLFGGQNLQPYGEQTQYDDMYILSIPSFTWIKVDKSDGTPRGRAGHTCSLYDGQMVVVGGFIGNNSDCDSPGTYVFDASSLEWQDEFKAADHKPDFHPDNFVAAGSNGYTVPKKVQEVIGGDDKGGATVTTPAAGSATGGPFATGSAPIFTVTQSGATSTITGQAEGGSDGDSDKSNSISPGLIAAAVIAGIFGALALYLGFCAWLYRRQVRAYKQHLAVANRYSGASNASINPAGLLFGRGRRHTRDQSQDSTDESFGWVGSDRERNCLTEPKWLSDDPSPGSGPGGGSGYTSTARRSEDTRPGTSGSGGSTEGLLEGQEPSFFSVVMGPRRALRVVNGAEQQQ